jgi:Fe-S cluster assembly iron-binding protein IscA
MLTVSDRAAQYLRESLTRKGEDAPEALRIVQTDDAYQLTLDNAQDGDQVFEQDGLNYLLLDAHVGDALSDATLDVHESPQGLSLTLSASG